jgi:hypothetical protein
VVSGFAAFEKLGQSPHFLNIPQLLSERMIISANADNRFFMRMLVFILTMLS